MKINLSRCKVWFVLGGEREREIFVGLKIFHSTPHFIIFNSAKTGRKTQLVNLNHSRRASQLIKIDGRLYTIALEKKILIEKSFFIIQLFFSLPLFFFYHFSISQPNISLTSKTTHKLRQKIL